MKKARPPSQPSSKDRAPAAPARSRWLTWGPPLLIALVISIDYYQVVGHQFVAWDDDQYATSGEPKAANNLHVLTGLSPENILWALTSLEYSNWFPLTWLSLMLDVQLFGPNPGEMHVVNALLHLANSLLLYWLLLRTTGARSRALFVALLFAVHPLHVESVAWISERKDVLSTLFWLLTSLAYVRYAEQPGKGRYALVLVLFVLAIMSKPMVVTLPCALLLMDYWPLKRLATTSWRKLILEKVPMFGLVVVSSILTVMAQRAGGAVRTTEEMPLLIRACNSAIAYLQYLRLMVWPEGLTCLYPFPITPNTSPEGRQAFILWGVAAAGVLLVVTGLCLWQRRSRPYLLFGWLWYLGTLVPVIGLVQVGLQAYADRYTYVPLIGIFVAITWLAADLAPRVPRGRAVLATVAALIVVACTVLTWRQVSVWRDTDTLLSRALRLTRNNYYLERQWALVLRCRNKIEEAVPFYRKAAESRPDLPFQRSEYGHVLLEMYVRHNTLRQQDQPFDAAWTDSAVLDEAERELQTSLEIRPEQSNALSDLGVIARSRGNPSKAMEFYREALEVDPNNADAHSNLGFSLVDRGEIQAGLQHLQKAVQLNPMNVAARAQIIDILIDFGRRGRLSPSEQQQIVPQLQELLEIDPTNQKAQRYLQSLSRGQYP